MNLAGGKRIWKLVRISVLLCILAFAAHAEVVVEDMTTVPVLSACPAAIPTKVDSVGVAVGGAEDLTMTEVCVKKRDIQPNSEDLIVVTARIVEKSAVYPCAPGEEERNTQYTRMCVLRKKANSLEPGETAWTQIRMKYFPTIQTGFKCDVAYPGFDPSLISFASERSSGLYAERYTCGVRGFGPVVIPAPTLGTVLTSVRITTGSCGPVEENMGILSSSWADDALLCGQRADWLALNDNSEIVTGVWLLPKTCQQPTTENCDKPGKGGCIRTCPAQRPGFTMFSETAGGFTLCKETQEKVNLVATDTIWSDLRGLVRAGQPSCAAPFSQANWTCLDRWNQIYTCGTYADFGGPDDLKEFCKGAPDHGWAWSDMVKADDPINSNACCGNTEADVGFVSSGTRPSLLCTNAADSYIWRDSSTSTPVGEDETEGTAPYEILPIHFPDQTRDFIVYKDDSYNERWGVCDPQNTLATNARKFSGGEVLPKPAGTPPAAIDCMQHYTQLFSSCLNDMALDRRHSSGGNNNKFVQCGVEDGRYCCLDSKPAGDPSDPNGCACYGASGLSFPLNPTHTCADLGFYAINSECDKPNADNSNGQCEDPGLITTVNCQSILTPAGFDTANCADDNTHMCNGLRIFAADSAVDQRDCCYGSTLQGNLCDNAGSNGAIDEDRCPSTSEIECLPTNDQNGNFLAAEEVCLGTIVDRSGVKCCRQTSSSQGRVCQNQYDPLAGDRNIAFICNQWPETVSVNVQPSAKFKECCTPHSCSNIGLQATGAGGSLYEIDNFDEPIPNPDAVSGWTPKTKLLTYSLGAYYIPIEDGLVRDWTQFDTLVFRLKTGNFNHLANLIIRTEGLVNSIDYTLGPIRDFVVGGLGNVKWHRIVVDLSGLHQSGTDLTKVNDIILTTTPLTSSSVNVDDVHLLPKTGSTKFCAGRFPQWLTDLDPPAGTPPEQIVAYRTACDTDLAYRTGTEWSGTRCCGDDGTAQYGEYFEDSSKGCFNSMTVPPDMTVGAALNIPNHEHIIFGQDKKFHTCKVKPVPGPQVAIDGLPSGVELFTTSNVDQVCAKRGAYHCTSAGVYSNTGEGDFFIDPLSPTQYSVCYNGQKVPVKQKYDMFQGTQGWCPVPTCYCPTDVALLSSLTPQMRTEILAACENNPAVQSNCLPESESADQYYCAPRIDAQGATLDAEWTNRLTLLGAELYTLVMNNNQDHTLYCDGPDKTFYSRLLPIAPLENYLSNATCILTYMDGGSETVILGGLLPDTTNSAARSAIAQVFNPHLDEQGSTQYSSTACDAAMGVGRANSLLPPKNCNDPSGGNFHLYVDGRQGRGFILLSTDRIDAWEGAPIFEAMWDVFRSGFTRQSAATVPLPADFSNLFLADTSGHRTEAFGADTWRAGQLSPLMKFTFSGFSTDVATLTELISGSSQHDIERIFTDQHLLVYTPSFTESTLSKYTAQARPQVFATPIKFSTQCGDWGLDPGEECDLGCSVSLKPGQPIDACPLQNRCTITPSNPTCANPSTTCACSFDFSNPCTCQDTPFCGNNIIDQDTEVCDGTSHNCQMQDICLGSSEAFVDFGVNGFRTTPEPGFCAANCGNCQQASWIIRPNSDGTDSDGNGVTDYCQNCLSASDQFCNCGENDITNPTVCMNGDFEFGLADPQIADQWTGVVHKAAGNIRDGNKRFSGFASLKAVSMVDPATIPRRTFSVQPGTYTISSMVYQSSGSASCAPAWMFVQSPISLAMTSVRDAWAPLQMEVIILPGQSTFELKLQPGYGCTAAEPTWFDQIRISHELLYNANFETIDPNNGLHAKYWPDRHFEVIFPLAKYGYRRVSSAVAPVYEGDFSIQLAGENAARINEPVSDQMISLQAGKNYRLVAHVYRSTDYVCATSSFMQIAYMDSGGGFTNLGTLSATTYGVWERVEKVFTAKTSQIRIAFWNTCAGEDGSYWDAVKLYLLD